MSLWMALGLFSVGAGIGILWDVWLDTHGEE